MQPLYGQRVRGLEHRERVDGFLDQVRNGTVGGAEEQHRQHRQGEVRKNIRTRVTQQPFIERPVPAFFLLVLRRTPPEQGFAYPAPKFGTHLLLARRGWRDFVACAAPPASGTHGLPSL